MIEPKIHACSEALAQPAADWLLAARLAPWGDLHFFIDRAAAPG